MTKTTPVLIVKDNKRYRLMNTTYEDDGSIYFSFPSKIGNVVGKCGIRLFAPNDDRVYSGERHTMNLEIPSRDYKYSKISFHPRDKVAHVIDQDGKRLYGDIKLMSMHSYEFIVPFMQVIVPNDLTILDEYNKTKYPITLDIPDDVRCDNQTISLEIYVHRNGFELDESVLFEAKRKLIGMYSFDSEHDYTCTIFLSTIDSSNNSVLAVLNGMNAIIMCTLDKNK